MLVANGLIDSIEVANSHFGRKAMQPDAKLGKPRDTDALRRPLRLRPLVAGRLFQAAGLRAADSAHRRQRFGRVAQSGRLQSRLRTPGQQLRLSAVVEEPEGGTGRRHQRAAAAGAGRERVAGPRVPRRGGPELELQIGLTLTTREPISYLEIVQDGQVRQSIRFEDYVKDGRLPPLHFKHSGWFLLRAVAETSDTYRFAMTGPVLRRVRRQAADQPEVGPVLPRLGLRACPADPDRRSAAAPRSDGVSPQGAGLLEGPCGEGQRGVGWVEHGTSARWCVAESQKQRCGVAVA